MWKRIIESLILLAYVDYVKCFGGLARIQMAIEKQETSSRTKGDASLLCRAINFGCVLYFKRVLCLQQSAAATILLRRHGFRAEMVIGVQMLPFESHAWVEVDGCVVNDKPYTKEMFEELARY